MTESPDQAAVDYAVLEIAEGMPPQEKKRLSALTARARSRLRGHIDASELTLKHPCLVSYWAQFNELPETHKNGFTWLEVAARLLKNPEKLERALRMQGGGQLFWVEPDGTINFKDRGVEPVMYVINTKTKKMTPIFNYDAEAIAKAKAEIARSRAAWQAEGFKTERQTLYWANGSDIEAQLQKDGYELFKDDGHWDQGKNDYALGPSMDHAAAVNPDHHFVASSSGGEYRSSWVQGGKVAFYRGAYDKHVYFEERSPNARTLEYIGVVRRLRV